MFGAGFAFAVDQMDAIELQFKLLTGQSLKVGQAQAGEFARVGFVKSMLWAFQAPFQHRLYAPS